METETKKRGAIAWMAGNHVASNLLMLFFILGGLFYVFNIKQEVFPEFDLDKVKIIVSLPGAKPSDVDKGIILPVEEAIQNIEGIKEILSTAKEGIGVVSVEVDRNFNVNRIAADIKNEVDRITTFPKEAELPRVVIPSRKREVLTLVLFGDQSDQVLHEVIEMIRDKLLQDDDITLVDFVGAKDFEMRIEISQEKLRTLNLKLSDVLERVKNIAIDVPGGSIEATGGEILVRVNERRDYALQFARIPVINTKEGGVVNLEDIAKISDRFEDSKKMMLYNGKPAIGIEVYRVGEQTPITVSKAVHRNMEQLIEELPEGLDMVVLQDRSDVFKRRMDILLHNGYIGLLLVFILLALFLEPRLAFWVTMGIPISFAGSFLIINLFGSSINMITMFAFIVSLGIVVDDAVILGENIYVYRKKGLPMLEASIEGAKEVAIPVTFSVLTNIVTFMPIYFISGTMGKIWMHIPIVVGSVFFISLIEALFILPSHLVHQKEEYRSRIMYFISKVQKGFSDRFMNRVKKIYAPVIKTTVRYRYITFTFCFVILIVSLSYVKSGHMGFTLFPRMESNYAFVTAELPYGSPVEETLKINNLLLNSLKPLIEKSGGEKQVIGVRSLIDENELKIRVFLTDPEVRPVNTREFVREWRKNTGYIPGLESIKFMFDNGPGSGSSLNIELKHRNNNSLIQASSELADALALYPIVSDIDDGFSYGKKQLDIKMKPEGYLVGLTPRDLATQIRHIYYGAEVLKQLRGRTEISVILRLSKKERNSEQFLDDMLIKTPKGSFVPLKSVAEVKSGRAYTAIERHNGRRKVTVTCDLNPNSKSDIIQSDLRKTILPRLRKKYAGLNYSFEGRQAKREESLADLRKGMIIAMFVVYILLAIPFKSYVHPLIIMGSIPFGIVGSIIGHIIMGYSLSLPSMLGVIALSGVVVNDSLVLIDFANRRVREGATRYSAILNACIRRFRPIMLTTLTTFFGLIPMIFETSREARWLVPMAISLGFGILFSTIIILILIPALYIITEDLMNLFQMVFSFDKKSYENR